MFVPAHFFQSLRERFHPRRNQQHAIKFVNPILVQHIRDGKILSEETIYNGVTTEGKNQLLDIMFRAQTQLTSWALGLVDNAGFSAFADGDTMASHAGWTEFDDYSQSNRVAWTQAAASAGSITNTTPATIDITGSGTLKGVFITSNNTINGTSGKLWATAAFNTTKPVVNGDQIKLTYTVSVS